MSLRMEGMVLVHVTTFNGRHKFQIRWKNREYVVEQQPYQNLLVYVVHPTDGGGAAVPTQNYLLPISNNLEQEEGENSVGGDGSSDELTPVTDENDVLLVDHLTESQLEGMPNSPSKQCKLFDPGSTRLTTKDPTDGGLQANNDTPVSPRWSLRTIRNQHHGGIRILHYSKMTSFPVPSIFGLAYASAFTSSHACTWPSWGIQSENTLFEPLQICPTHMMPGIDGDTIHVDSVVDFWMGRVDQRIFGLSTAASLEKPKRQLPSEALWVSGQYDPEDGVHNRITKKQMQNLP